MADQYWFPCGCTLVLDWERNKVTDKTKCEEHS